VKVVNGTNKLRGICTISRITPESFWLKKGDKETFLVRKNNVLQVPRETTQLTLFEAKVVESEDLVQAVDALVRAMMRVDMCLDEPEFYELIDSRYALQAAVRGPAPDKWKSKNASWLKSPVLVLSA